MSRNLAEHPITIDEIIKCLEHQIGVCIDFDREFGVIGDMRPMLLQAALDIVRSANKLP